MTVHEEFKILPTWTAYINQNKTNYKNQQLKKAEHQTYRTFSVVELIAR